MRKQYFYAILVLLCALVYIVGLFPDVSVDAAKYAAISRYMFESGDLIHMKIHGEPYMQKPLFFFWLSSLSFSLFGVSIFAFKLPTLLFSALGVYSLFRLTRLYYGVSIARLAAFMYATSQMLFLYNADTHTDALLTANIIFGIWQLAEFLDKRKFIHLLAGFTGAGLALITKGPIGLAIPAIAIGGHLIMKKEWKTIFSPLWLAGLPVLAVILYPTLKGNFDQFGWEGIRFFFLTNNVGRITGEYAGSNTDYFFYFHTMLYIFLPWSFYTFAALFMQGRNAFHPAKKHRKRVEYISYSVIIVYTLILSIARQKAPHYFFPVVPFLCIIVADFIHKCVNVPSYAGINKWLMGFRTVVIILTWLLAFLIPLLIFPTTKFWIWLIFGLILVFLVYSFTMKFSLKEKLLIPLAITSIGLNFIINAHFIPTANTYQGIISASYAYNELADEGEALFTYDYQHFESYFYAKSVSNKIKNSNELHEVLNGSGIWIITTEKGFVEIVEIANERITHLKEFDFKMIYRMTLLFLNPETRQDDLRKVYLLKIESTP